MLAIVSTLIGVLDIVAFNGILKAVLAKLITSDPIHSMQSRYLAGTLERFGIVIFAIVWLVSMMFVFYYYDQSRTRRILVARFIRVTAIQLSIVLVGYALPHIMARL